MTPAPRDTVLEVWRRVGTNGFHAASRMLSLDHKGKGQHLHKITPRVTYWPDPFDPPAWRARRGETTPHEAV